MKKTKLILDFDGTIVDSVKAFCSEYNIRYTERPGFKPANPNNVVKWNLLDECPVCPDIHEIFDSNEFFNRLEFMDGALEVIKELNEKYEIIICSIGTLKNISEKASWIEKNLPFIKNTILINNEGVKMDKSIINMEGAYFIDDVSSNLYSSNALVKICFGKLAEWNENWTSIRKYNWNEVKEYLL